MSRSGMPTAIVVVVVVAIIIGGYLAWQLRTERQALAQLQERATALEQARSPVEPAATTLPAPEAPRPEQPMATPTDAPAPSPAAPAPAATRQQVIVMRADGTPDPDPEAGARAMIRMFYGDIEKDLGVSKEEMDALLKLVARGNGTPAEFDAATGGRYSQLQERQRYGVAENNLSSLRTALAVSSRPLTDPQVETIRSGLMAELRRRDEEFAANLRPTDPRALLDYEDQQVRILEESNQRLIASAREHLSPGQVAVWQELLDLSVSTRRRSLQARRAQLEAGGSGAATPAPLYVYPYATPPPASSRR